MTRPDIPQGMSTDAAATWPPRELIDSFLGNFDFELRPGEATEIGDNEAAQAAARQFRDTLGRYCSGVTVVTSESGGEPVGMTCQSFASVSIDPPLITFIPMKTSRAWPVMQRAGHFAVNVLAADQAEVSNKMASKGADKFAGVDWSPGKTGSPLLAGAIAHIDCTVHAVHDAGDHWIVVGRVQEMDYVVDDEGNSPDPLLFYQGQYRTTR